MFFGHQRSLGSTDWANPAVTFPIFSRLLKEPTFCHSVLLGMTISVGGLTESLVSVPRNSALFVGLLMSLILGPVVQCDCLYIRLCVHCPPIIGQQTIRSRRVSLLCVPGYPAHCVVLLDSSSRTISHHACFVSLVKPLHLFL